MYTTQERELQQIERSLRIKTPYDWYNVTNEDLKQFSEMTVVKEADGSFFKLIKKYYPSETWSISRFVRDPALLQVRSSPERLVLLAEWLLNLKKLEDWNDVTEHDIVQMGGRGQITAFGTVHAILAEVYPEHHWHFHAGRTPRSYWLDIKNRLAFIKDIQRDFGSWKSWYNVTHAHLRERGGGGLLNYYGFHMHRMLSQLLPQHNWDKSKFRDALSSRPARYFNEEANRQQVFRELERNLGISSIDGWYDITTDKVYALGGAGLVQRFGSLRKTLVNMYNDYDWDMTKFRSFAWMKPAFVPKRQLGHWQKQDNVKAFLDKAALKLNVTNPYDWYRISQDQIRKLGGTGLSRYWPRVLTQVYPKHNFDVAVFTQQKRRAIQRALLYCVQKVLPRFDIMEEYTSGMKTRAKGSISFDIFIPALNMAIEYQGMQHYQDFPQRYGSASVQEGRDLEKTEHCAAQGITLVPVPYWWRPGDVQTVAATIKHFRPDLNVTLSDSARPLLGQPLHDHTMAMGVVSNLMNADSNREIHINVV